MKSERIIFKNTLALSTGKVLGDLCSFFFLAYLGRTFGVAVLGKYGIAMAIGGLLSIISSFGFNTLIVREVSRDRRKNIKLTGNLLLSRGIVSLSAWCLLGAILLPIAHIDLETKLILLLIIGYHVFYRLTGIIRASFVAHEEMHYSALLEIFHKIFLLAMGSAAIYLFGNPVIALASYPLSSLAMFLLGCFLFSKSKSNQKISEFPGHGQCFLLACTQGSGSIVRKLYN